MENFVLTNPEHKNRHNDMGKLTAGITS